MDPVSPIYVLLFAGLAQLTGWLALFILRHPRQPGSDTLGSLLLALTVRALAGLFEYLTPGLAAKVLAAKIGYLGFAAIGPLWLAFALRATGRNDLLTRRDQAFLVVISLAVAGLALTNEWHGLIWREIGLDPAGYPGLFTKWGIAGSLFALLTSAYLLTGAFFYATAFARAARAYRRQAGIRVAAALVPLAGNAIALAGVLPTVRLDLTQISLPVAGAILGVGFSRLGRLDLAPVAARVVMDNLRDAVIVLDAAGRVADLNAAARRLFNVGDEAAGRAAAETLRLRPADVWQKYAGATEAQAEVEVAAAGRAEQYQLTITPLHDERGRLLGRVALLRDVSHERALLKMRDDLAHMLIHDLRNPFSAIYSSLQLIDTLLKSEAEPAEANGRERPLPRAAAVQGAIEIALHSSARAQHMLDSLLDLNRLESGQLPVTPEALEAGLAVQAVAQALTPAAAERGLRLEVEIPPDLPAGLADPELLDRVLHNLVGNAIKYTPAGGRVTLAARADEAGLTITVADTGPGIPPQIEPRLFQKFVRGPGPVQGSGLGLAFCKLAVEAMGGRIWAESEAGRGAVFRFTLPAAPTPERQSRSPNPD